MARYESIEDILLDSALSQFSVLKTILAVFVPGVPAPTARPRRAKTGHYYTPKSKKYIAWVEAIKQRLPAPSNKTDKPLHVEIVFFMPRPKKHFTSRGEIKPRYKQVYHTAKPDIDNLSKTVLDIMQQLGWFGNDSQVVSLVAQKVWGGASRPHSGMSIVCRSLREDIQ